MLLEVAGVLKIERDGNMIETTHWDLKIFFDTCLLVMVLSN